MSEKKELNVEQLEKVSGGYEDGRFGVSYSAKESERIPPGTKLIYTDTRDNYKPHACTYVRFDGGNYIVLAPDDDNCRWFLSQLFDATDNGNAFRVYYTTISRNHLYNALSE